MQPYTLGRWTRPHFAYIKRRIIGAVMIVDISVDNMHKIHLGPRRIERSRVGRKAEYAGLGRIGKPDMHIEVWTFALRAVHIHLVLAPRIILVAPFGSDGRLSDHTSAKQRHRARDISLIPFGYITDKQTCTGLYII